MFNVSLKFKKLQKEIQKLLYLLKSEIYFTNEEFINSIMKIYDFSFNVIFFFLLFLFL